MTKVFFYDVRLWSEIEPIKLLGSCFMTLCLLFKMWSKRKRIELNFSQTPDSLHGLDRVTHHHDTTTRSSAEDSFISKAWLEILTDEEPQRGTRQEVTQSYFMVKNRLGAWIKSHDDKTTHHWRWYKTHSGHSVHFFQDAPVSVGYRGNARRCGTKRRPVSFSQSLVFLQGWVEFVPWERGRSECIFHSDDPLTPWSRKELAVFRSMMDGP